MALITLTRGLRERFDRHVAIARWTLPIWLYVSVTGVVVYVMLYRLYSGCYGFWGSRVRQGARFAGSTRFSGFGEHGFSS